MQAQLYPTGPLFPISNISRKITASTNQLVSIVYEIIKILPWKHRLTLYTNWLECFSVYSSANTKENFRYLIIICKLLILFSHVTTKKKLAIFPFTSMLCRNAYWIQNVKLEMGKISFIVSASTSSVLVVARTSFA